MIYITADTHGQKDFAKLKEFATKNASLTKDDYVIIAGDFGAVWDKGTLKEDLKPYQDLPFTILFVDGNHENFDMLKEYPVSEWHGGKVHFISPTILHLMRGQVFEIEGKKIFAFGGGTSIDKKYRKEHISWWKEEIPSEEEQAEAKNNLERVGNRVDYVITHCPPAYITDYLYRKSLLDSYIGKVKYLVSKNQSDEIVEDVLKDIKANIFYCGHEHIDEKIELRKRIHVLLCKNIIEIC